jgi:hypothetical protein
MEPLALERHFVTIDSSLPPQAYHLARKCSWEIMESLTITSWAIASPLDDQLICGGDDRRAIILHTDEELE